MMDQCRVCMRRQTNMSHLFDNNSDDEIIMKIQFCTGVLFTKMDVLPSKICQKCLDNLQIAYKFKMKCLNSDQVYRDLVLVKIKDEPQDIGDGLNADNDHKAFVDDGKDIIKNDNCDDNVHDDLNVMKEETEKDSDVNLFIEMKDTKVFVKSVSRKSKRVKLKKNVEQCSVTNEENVTAVTQTKARKSRGPYLKKDKQPKRLAKLKFRKLFCEACNMKFATKTESDEHKKKFHNEPNLWICEICGKSFVHRSSQHSHMRVHYPPRFQCDHCDYKTANKHDLRKHLRIHTGSKSYVCTVCASAYRTSSNLHAHVRLMHERVRRHACAVCPRAFNDRTKLNRHMDTHNDVKRYSCEVCHSCFTRRCYWKKHLQKQHDIIIPSCRPGRQRTEVILTSDQ